MADGFTLRQAGPQDHAALSMVCLKTGNSGQDGTLLQDDPALLGLVYALPYQVRCPDLAFVVEDAQGVCGYAFGAPDTMDFIAWMDHHWLPPLRARIANPGPDDSHWRQSDWVRWRIHAPASPPPLDLTRFPAHGHIDLLPRAQGQGLGRALMTRVMDGLRGHGCPGMFLEVSPQNPRALGFYATLGFQMLDPPGLTLDTVYMVKDLGGTSA